MRTLILATAATLVAAPAFANGIDGVQASAPTQAPVTIANPTATANFTLFVQEDCTFDRTDTTQELALRSNGNGIRIIEIDVNVECNTPFEMTAVDGLENEVSMARVENRSTIASQYKEAFKGKVEVTTGASKNSVGRYPSQDVAFGYRIKWEKGGTGSKTNGFAAGNYTGKLVFMLTGRDVEKAGQS